MIFSSQVDSIYQELSSGNQDCVILFLFLSGALGKKHKKNKGGEGAGLGAKKKPFPGFYFFFFPSERWEQQNPSGFSSHEAFSFSGTLGINPPDPLSSI